MKRKIIISILIIIFAAVATIAVNQWNNISAIIDGIRYDEQELENKAVTTEAKVNEYLESNNFEKITPMTPEQEKALQSGQITPEDAVKVMTGSMTFEEAKEAASSGKSEKPSDSKTDAPEKEPEKTPDTEKNEDVNYDKLISEKVAQLYVVKSNFYARFNNCWAQEKARFLALPKEERTQAKILEIVKQCIPQGAAMEDECDAQVDAILKELKVLLDKAGRKDTLTSTIKKAYEEEKKSMKARLINKYF